MDLRSAPTAHRFAERQRLARSAFRATLFTTLSLLGLTIALLLAAVAWTA